MIRFGTKINSSNGSSYPGGGDLPISIRGAIPVIGGTRTYQAWYRNPNGPCNTGSNLTNGVQVTWVPQGRRSHMTELPLLVREEDEPKHMRRS